MCQLSLAVASWVQQESHFLPACTELQGSVNVAGRSCNCILVAASWELASVTLQPAAAGLHLLLLPGAFPAPTDVHLWHVQVVLTGLLVLLPHMRAPLLAFPKLCSAFFSLVGSLLEVHPDEMARLPGTASHRSLFDTCLCVTGAINMATTARSGFHGSSCGSVICCHLAHLLPALPAPIMSETFLGLQESRSLPL